MSRSVPNWSNTLYIHLRHRESRSHHTNLPMAGGTPSDDTRDFLTHLETYLAKRNGVAKRDGVDKLLKISRYASKIALASPSLLPDPHPLRPRLKSFESSVGLSRKAFRLGKFVQDLNALYK